MRHHTIISSCHASRWDGLGAAKGNPMARQAQTHEACAAWIFSSSECEQHTRPLPSAPLDVTSLRAPPPVVQNVTWLSAVANTSYSTRRRPEVNPRNVVASHHALTVPLAVNILREHPKSEIFVVVEAL
jgi:hypothetical protein